MKKFVNILTSIRIIATLFLPILWHFSSPIFILLFIAMILLTDSLDGFFARKYHVQSLFGSLLDAIADKTFGIMLLLIVSSIYKWFYFLVIYEIIIAVITIIAAACGATTNSSFLGKAKTWIVGISIIIFLTIWFIESGYINLNIPIILDNKESIILACLFTACGSEEIVIIDYIRIFFIDIKKNKNNSTKKLKFKSKDGLYYVLFDTDYYIKNKEKPLIKHLSK